MARKRYRICVYEQMVSDAGVNYTENTFKNSNMVAIAFIVRVCECVRACVSTQMKIYIL